MKKIFYVFLLITGLASCKSVGGGKSTNVSSDIDSGFLISKKPFDFDTKFGYGLFVIKTIDSLTNKSEYEEVWISRQTYDVLPAPDDSTKILIYYVRDIETGRYDNKDQTSFWDCQFNFCSGYRVNRK
ncbi:MAG: hypothetical protein U0469_01205 [Candidatus Paceibacterota bacterium]|jgi:hypothetical protein